MLKKCKVGKIVAFLLALVFTLAFMSGSAMNVKAAEGSAVTAKVPEHELPVGGVLPIVSHPLTAEEAADIPVLVKAKKKSPIGVQAYTGPQVPGGSDYGYNWLNNRPEKATLTGLYEAFVQFSDETYKSQTNFDVSSYDNKFAENGSIDISAYQLPFDKKETSPGTEIDSEGANTKNSLVLLSLAWNAFIYDNPQYYLLSNGYGRGTDNVASGIFTNITPFVSVEFKDYSIRQKYNDIIERKYAEYSDLAKTVTTTYGKARFVHDKILADRDYSFIDGFPDTSVYAHNILGVMDTSTDGPVCEAYAKAYAYILNRLGIEASVWVGLSTSGGNGGGGAHAWNTVKIDENHYYADLTWDDSETVSNLGGSSEDSRKNEQNILHYSFFLVGATEEIITGDANLGVFTASHTVANSSGTVDDVYLYDLPNPIANTKAADDTAKTWINSFLPWYMPSTHFIAFTDKLLDETGASPSLFIMSSGTPVWVGQNKRSFGTLFVDKDSTDIAVNAQAYKWDHTGTSGNISQVFANPTPIAENSDYVIEVEKPYKSGENRAWVYGKGTYAGLDFGWVTLDLKDAVATVADIAVAGDVGTVLIESKATLTLKNASVVRTGLASEDAKSWFTGLPSGISVTANGAALSNTIELTFSGTPTSGSNSPFKITIPESVQTSGNDLSVETNPDAKFAIVDTVVPTISNLDVPSATHNSATLTFNSSEAGTGYYLVRPENDTELPVAANIKASGKSFTVTSGPNTVTVNELDASADYKVYVVVEDASSNLSTLATKEFSTLAAPIGPAKPSITTSSLTDGTVGEDYSYTLEATGDGTIKWTATNLPAGLTLSESGILSGTPTTAGSSQVTVTAKNDVDSDSAELTIVIKDAPLQLIPVITTSSLPDGTIGVLYSHKLTANGEEPIEWSVTAGALGLELTPDGIVSGTPLTVGTQTFTVAAENVHGIDTKELTLTVTEVPQVVPVAPTITTSSLPSGTVGTAYSQTLTATGDEPIEWFVEDGDLPNGLVLSPDGIISGTPTTAGAKTFFVYAINDAGYGEKELSITIYAVSSGGGSGGGGSGGSTYNPPSTSSSTPETVNVPAANNSTTVGYVPSGETAKVELPSGKVTEIISKSKNGIADIDLSKASGIAAAELPSTAVKEFAKSDLGLSVALPSGEVSFDATALSKISGEAKGNEITIILKPAKSLNAIQQAKVGNRPVFDVSISSGGIFFTSLGNGYLTVKFPYAMKPLGKPERVKIYCLRTDGSIEDMKASYNVSTKIASFTTNHLSTYYISYDEWINTYPDVSGNEWFYEYVERVSEIGLMSGTDKGFEPNTNLTRSMVVTILFNLAKPARGANTTNFTDVPLGQWYSDPIAWAASAGIVSGTGNNKFEPNRSVTREEMMAILYRFARWQGKGPVGNWAIRLDYPDVNEVSDWAGEAVMWTTMKGIVSGTPVNGVNVINPKGTSTRAEAATIISRYIDAVE
ncbi:MAG: S-layer homology domain-containing protein [Clostridiales bacterium]|jgi:hypothetical protein|nr:S-layer homology domain-containing protein [Clostridiales bacterium]